MSLFSEIKSGIKSFFQHSDSRGSEDSDKSPLVGRPVRIPSKKMGSMRFWAKNASYELLFATREGLPIKGFPITHSAVAFRKSEDETYTVYGRQSPFDLSSLKQHGFHWRTRVDNEKKYLPKGFNFTAYPTGVFFNLEEMSYILHRSDELINERQYCTMAISNCYSFSITAMILAIEKLLLRPVFEPDDVRQILSVMQERMKDHLSIGVANNDVVVSELEKVLESVKQRVDASAERADKDSALLSQILKVREIIEGSIVRTVSFLV